MNNDHIFLYWDEYETPQSGSKSEVENNNQNDKTKRNNTRRNITRVHR